MSQLWWGFQDNSGKIYNVHLYHGDESGHVLVYVNDLILIIDFSVIVSKIYTFYINERLFTLSMTRENTGFDYRLELENLLLVKDRINIDKSFAAARLREKIIATAMVVSVLVLALGTWCIFFG